MPHGFACLTNQPQDRRLGNAIVATKTSCRRAGSILSYQALDRLSRFLAESLKADTAQYQGAR